MYIVIETFLLEHCFVVTNKDGEAKVFNSFEDAEKEKKDCQLGVIVPL